MAKTGSNIRATTTNEINGGNSKVWDKLQDQPIDDGMQRKFDRTAVNWRKSLDRSYVEQWRQASPIPLSSQVTNTKFTYISAIKQNINNIKPMGCARKKQFGNTRNHHTRCNSVLDDDRGDIRSCILSSQQTQEMSLKTRFGRQSVQFSKVPPPAKLVVPKILRQSEVLARQMGEKVMIYQREKCDEGQISAQRLQSRLQKIRINIKNDNLLDVIPTFDGSMSKNQRMDKQIMQTQISQQMRSLSRLDPKTTTGDDAGAFLTPLNNSNIGGSRPLQQQLMNKTCKSSFLLPSHSPANMSCNWKDAEPENDKRKKQLKIQNIKKEKKSQRRNMQYIFDKLNSMEHMNPKNRMRSPQTSMSNDFNDEITAEFNIFPKTKTKLSRNGFCSTQTSHRKGNIGDEPRFFTSLAKQAPNITQVSKSPRRQPTYKRPVPSAQQEGKQTDTIAANNRKLQNATLMALQKFKQNEDQIVLDEQVNRELKRVEAKKQYEEVERKKQMEKEKKSNPFPKKKQQNNVQILPGSPTSQGTSYSGSGTNPEDVTHQDAMFNSYQSYINIQEENQPLHYQPYKTDRSFNVSPKNGSNHMKKEDQSSLEESMERTRTVRRPTFKKKVKKNSQGVQDLQKTDRSHAQVSKKSESPDKSQQIINMKQLRLDKLKNHISDLQVQTGTNSTDYTPRMSISYRSQQKTKTRLSNRQSSQAISASFNIESDREQYSRRQKTESKKTQVKAATRIVTTAPTVSFAIGAIGKNLKQALALNLDRLKEQNYADEMKEYDKLSDRVVKMNDCIAFQENTFRELGISDYYQQMRKTYLQQKEQEDKQLKLDPNYKKDNSLKRIEPEIIDSINCSNQIKKINRNIKEMKNNLRQVVQDKEDDSHHIKIEAFVPNSFLLSPQKLIKKISITHDVMESVPFFCKIPVKGKNGPLKIVIKVITPESEALEAKKVAQENQKQAAASRKKTSPPPKTKGKATFMTLSGDECTGECATKVQKCQDDPPPKAPMHDLTIFTSAINPDPTIDIHDVKINCSKIDRVFFKIFPRHYQEQSDVNNMNGPVPVQGETQECIFKDKFVYFSFYSYTGCKVNIKSAFSIPQKLQNQKKESEEETQQEFDKKENLRADQEEFANKQIRELQQYYIDNVDPELIEQDIIKTNKLRYVSRDVMIENRMEWEMKKNIKQAEAHVSWQIQEEFKREKKLEVLTHWDQYKQQKLILVKKYISVMKKGKRLKEFLIRNMLSRIMMAFNKTFQQQSLKRHRKLRQVFITVKFYCKYKVMFQRRMGPSLHFRYKNILRQCFGFTSGIMHQSDFTVKCRQTIATFLHDAKPIVYFIQKLADFKGRIKFIEQLRQKMVITRICRKKFIARLFERELKFLLEFFNAEKQEQLCVVTGAEKRTFIKECKRMTKALKRIDRPEQQKCIQALMRMQFCEYMLMVNEFEKRKLNTRIQLNQMVLEAKMIKIKKQKTNSMICVEPETPVFTEDIKQSFKRQLTSKMKDVNDMTNLMSAEFQQGHYRDKLFMERMITREKEWIVEQHQLEKKLYGSVGEDQKVKCTDKTLMLMELHQTVDKSFQHLIKKQKMRVQNILQSRIIAMFSPKVDALYQKVNLFPTPEKKQEGVQTPNEKEKIKEEIMVEFENGEIENDPKGPNHGSPGRYVIHRILINIALRHIQNSSIP